MHVQACSIKSSIQLFLVIRFVNLVITIYVPVKKVALFYPQISDIYSRTQGIYPRLAEGKYLSERKYLRCKGQKVAFLVNSGALVVP